VVVIKSTGGSIAEFEQQNNLYTLLEQGMHCGEIIDKKHVVSCISRVLTSHTDWQAILQCAAKESIDIVISNTTEAGLVYEEEVLNNHPPQSFPAKLTAYLLHRYNTFNGSLTKGMLILPTELRNNNGELLKEFVLQHARYNKLPAEFLAWVNACCNFCNTLVDRIVPGKSEKDDLIVWNNKLSYFDSLHTKTEPFLLWAIEGNNTIKEKLSFAQIDDRVLIAENIEGYKEQKLRILNGSNSIVISPAYLAGCNTLLDTVTDPLFSAYTTKLINNEIIPTIIAECPNAHAFAKDVLDRFGNPFIQYQLLNIAFQASSKMNSRNTATIVKYYRAYGEFPPLILIGFASFFLFYTPEAKKDGSYYALRDTVTYYFRDEHAQFLCGVLENINWLNSELATEAINTILGNNQVFSPELSALPGLAGAIANFCMVLKRDGIKETIAAYLNIQ
jgi:tagaturonate reductase